jgi:hypothetical protein
MLDLVRAFSEDAAQVLGAPSIAPAAEDVAATSARMAAAGPLAPPLEPVGATLPSRRGARPPGLRRRWPASPRRSRRPSRPSPRPRARACSRRARRGRSRPGGAEEASGRARRRRAAAALAVAGLAAGWGLRASAARAALRQRLEAFYRAQREPAAEACREQDPQALEKLVRALPDLADDPSDECGSGAGRPRWGRCRRGRRSRPRPRSSGAGQGDGGAPAPTRSWRRRRPAPGSRRRSAWPAGPRSGPAARTRPCAGSARPWPPAMPAAAVPGHRADGGGARRGFRLLKEAVELQPDYAEAHFALGRAHGPERGRDPRGQRRRRRGGARAVEGPLLQGGGAGLRARQGLCPKP